MTATASKHDPAATIVPPAATPAAAQTATPPDLPTSATETPVDSERDTADAGRRKDPSAEAAARRHQLREAETTISTQAAQITAMQRAAAEGAVSSATDLRGDGSHAVTLQRPADLWEVLGAEPGQFFDEGGALDKVALADFIAETTQGRDYLTKATDPALLLPRNAAFDAASSMHRGMTARHGSGEDAAWSEALA